MSHLSMATIVDLVPKLSTTPIIHTATPEEHVSRLEAEMVNLDCRLKKLIQGHAIAFDNRRKHEVYYLHLIKKQNLLARHGQELREELYNAVMSGDGKRVEKVEVKITEADTDAHKIQVQIPMRLKGFAEAIKRQQDYDEALAAKRNQQVLKLEEIHKYRPCQTLHCDHCRGKAERNFTLLRGGSTADQKRGYKGEDGNGRHTDFDEDLGETKVRGMMSRIVRRIKSVRF